MADRGTLLNLPGRGRDLAFGAARGVRTMGVLRAFCVTTTAFYPMAPALAGDPGIVTDGRTNTTVQINGSTTDVRTGTIHGGNSYNSFSKFNVNSGRTVNLHIPDGARSSINLVHGARTQIDGTLNSVRKGEIGGDLYILNTNGVVVGPSGRVNTGSFNVQTPSKEFLDNVLDSSGRPNAERVRQITGAPETIPLSPNGVIKVQGEINAVRSVNLHGASADIAGRINTGQSARDAIRAAVNLEGVEQLGSGAARVNVRTTGSTRISGTINAEGGAGRRGGDVTVRAGGNIELAAGARVSARGTGADSKGGVVLIRAAEQARFDAGAIIDVRGGDSGDGGFVDFSADERVVLAGGRFMAGAVAGAAGSIVIDPKEIVIARAEDVPSVGADGNLSLLATESVRFEGSVLVQVGDGGDLFVAAPDIQVGSGVTLETMAGTDGKRGNVTLIAVAGNLTDDAYETRAAFEAAIKKGENSYLETGDIADLAALTHTSYGLVERKASITIDGATIIGNNVTIRAGAAAAARLYDSEQDGNAAEALAQSLQNSGQLAGLNQLLGDDNPIGVNILAAIARASAEIEITGNASITADADLVIDADAIAGSTPNFDGSDPKYKSVVSLGGLYAEAEAKASVRIGSGATLKVGAAAPESTLSLTADTKTTVESTAVFAASGANPVALGATFAFGSSTALVNVNGATLLATPDTSIRVRAKTDDSYSASTTVTATREDGEGEAPGGGVAAIVTYANFASRADAHLDLRGEDGGTVQAKDLELSALSIIAKSAVSASGELKAEEKENPQEEGAQDGSGEETADGEGEQEKSLLDAVMGKVAETVNGAMSALTVVLEGTSISGAVAIQEVDQSATARLASGITLSGDLAVNAKAENERVENRALVEGGIQDATFGVALALPVALVNANADAVIGREDGSAIAVKAADVTVDSKVRYPGPEGLYTLITKPFDETADKTENDSGAAIENLSFLDPVWNSNLYNFIAGNDSLSGAFDDVEDQLFNSISGAKTSVAGAEEGQGETNSISIVLNNNVAVFDTTANATIGKGVTVDANSVSVTAASEVEYLTLAGDAKIGKSGAGEGSTSLGVALTVTDIDNAARARVEDGAVVRTAKDITVAARSDERLATVGYSADLQGGDLGVSGAVGVNFVKGTAEATVGKDAQLVSQDGDVSVTATDHLQAVNIAGGIVQGNNVGVGASVAFNQANSNVNASVAEAKAIEGRNVAVDASNSGFSVALALSGSLNMPEAPTLAGNARDNFNKFDDQYKGLHGKLFSTQDGFFDNFSGSVSDGGSDVVAANQGAPDENGEASDTTGAAGTNKAVDASDAKTPSAGSRSNPLAKAISEAVGQFGINISADAAVNLVTNSVTALLNADTVDAASVDVTAESELKTIGLAGAVTVKKGGSGGQGGGGSQVSGSLAGSFTHNGFDRNVVSARIADVGALNAQTVNVEALNRQQVWGIAVSGSGTTAGGDSSSREFANLAGSVNFNTMRGGETLAEIAGSTLEVEEDVTVSARDEAMIVSLVGGAIYSGRDTSVGIGAAATVNMLETDTTARIAGSNVMAGGGVAVKAQADRLVASVGMGVAVQTGNDSALTGAVTATYNSIGGTILSEVVSSGIDARGLTVSARDTSIIGSGAGDAAISTSASNQVTAGIATAINNMANDVRSRVTGSTINVGEDASILAELDRLAVAVAAGVSVTKGAVSLKGSVAVNLVGVVHGKETGVYASLDGESKVESGRVLTVSAKDTSKVHGYAGALSAGKGSAGIGAAIVVNAVGNTVESRVGSATIEGLSKLNVLGHVDTTIVSVAVSASGSQNAAVSGAIVVNVLDGTSRAIVGADAEVKDTASVLVGARNDSTIASAAGAGAISTSGGVGVGGAATIDVYTKKTLAAFDGKARLSGTLSVLAQASDRAYGGVAAFGVSSGGVGIAGAVGIVVGQNETVAVIGSEDGSRADIVADGNVIVDAYATSDIIRANLSGAVGNVGVAGLASVEYLAANTRAEIAGSAHVVAYGRGDASKTRDGEVTYAGLDLGATTRSDDEEFDTSQDAKRVQKLVSDAHDDIAGKKNEDGTREPGKAPTEVDPSALFKSSQGERQVHGVSVTADSDARMINLGLAVAFGSDVGVGLGATATVSETKTTARIGDGARVNQVDDLASAGDAQRVIVRAGSTMLSVGAAGGVGASGNVGVGGGAEISIGNRQTLAEIGDKAHVSARGGVNVLAGSKDTSVSVALGISGGGTAAVGAGVAVGVAESTTIARLGDEARVRAGTLAVEAKSQTERFQVVGSGGISGTVGVGAAIGVLVDANTTHAIIGTKADIEVDTQVLVNAQAKAAYRTFTVALGGSGVVGVAGSVAIKALRSNTLAEIGDKAKVVVNGKGEGGDSVVVSARSEFDLLSITGGAGVGGKVGIGAGFDMMVGRATTQARIGKEAEVQGAGNVRVRADADKTADSTAIAAGLGAFVGVAGAVNVMLFGQDLSADERAKLSGGKGDNLSSTSAEINGRLQNDVFGGALNIHSSGQDADAATRTSVKKGDTSAELSAATVDFGQTRAQIDTKAVVRAGGDVEVLATDVTRIDVRSGGLGGGLVGIGMGAAVSKVRNTTIAEVGDKAKIFVDGGLSVRAVDGVGGRNKVLTFTGAAGAFAGNIAIAIADTASATKARIGDEATVGRWNKTAEAYDWQYRFKFDAGQRVRLKAQGLTDAEIDAEEKRRTLLYHVVHEELIGMGRDEALHGLSKDEYELYWSLREVGLDKDGKPIHAPFDIDLKVDFSAAGQELINARIENLATQYAEDQVRTAERAITQAVLAFDVPANGGVLLQGGQGYDVAGIYNEANTDANYVRYWDQRGIEHKTVVVGTDENGNTITRTTWVAQGFPEKYDFEYAKAERDTLMAGHEQERSQALNENFSDFAENYKNVYEKVHQKLTASFGPSDVTKYDPDGLSGDEALYWLGRGVKASAGAVEVSAVEANSVTARAYGASLGGMAVGGQIALALKGGEVLAEIGDGAIVDAQRLTVLADQKGSAEAHAVGGNAGTFAAAGGVVSLAHNDASTTARIGDGAAIRTVEGINVRAEAAPRVKATAIGANVSGGYSVGVSSATTKLSNKVLTEIGSDARLSAGGNVTVVAESAKPAADENAEAYAAAGSGGGLIGASGAVAINEVSTTVDTKLGSGVALNVADIAGVDARDMTVLSVSNSTAKIQATGIGGGFVGIGAVYAENDLRNTARTNVGHSLSGNVSGTLRVASDTREKAVIEAISGSGGVVAGAAAVVENTIRNTTRTIFANGAAGAGIQVGRLDVQALHDRAYASASSTSVRASLVGASGAWANTAFVSDVGVTLGSGLAANAVRGIKVEARNVVQKAQNNGTTIRAGSGGLFDLSAAFSRTTLDNEVAVGIGGASLKVTGAGGEMNILASNDVAIADTVSLDAGGAIAGAISESVVRNVNGPDRAAINVSGGSHLETRSGSITLQTATTGGIDMRASSKTYGGAGGAGAIANASYSVANTITVGGGSQIRSGLDLNLIAGDRAGTVRANTYAYAYNKTMIPIATIPDIHPTDVRANNSVRIENANVQAGAPGTLAAAARDVNIDTRGPNLSARGHGEAEDWTKALAAIFENIGRFFTGKDPKPLKKITHSGTVGTVQSVDIGAGSTVQAGMGNRRGLHIEKHGDVYVDRSAYAGTPGAIGFTVAQRNIAQETRDEILALYVALQAETDSEKREILRGEIETLRFLLDHVEDKVIDVIALDDVKVDTGDVNIFTTSLTGRGTVRAQSDLVIDIRNESSASLRVNDLEVAATRTGAVRLNGRAMNAHATLDVQRGGGERRITVENDWSGTNSNLFLDGKVINRQGDIRLGSTGSIVIGGDIEGSTVELMAQNAIIQRYRPGFTHVGGLPYVEGSRGSMIAGGSIFLAGKYLNINGTVQGGIPIRNLDLSADMTALFDQYDAIYKLFENKTLSAEVLANGAWKQEAVTLGEDLLAGAEAATMVRLNSFLDDGQPIVAAYNLATREIEVQNTAVGGGLVTLYGHIISTGNGKINVTDGFGELTVDNKADRSLLLHGLDTGQGIQGKVKIIDTAHGVEWDNAQGDPTKDNAHKLATVTEITRNANGQVVTQTFDRVEYREDGKWVVDVLADPDGRTVSDTASRESKYDPKDGQKYHYLRLTTEGAPECEQLSACSGADAGLGTDGYGWLASLFTRVLGEAGGLVGGEPLDASHSIAVNFIGSDAGKIDVASQRDIIIGGNVTNTTGTTQIVSREGDILRRGDATVTAGHLTLLAEKGRIGAEGDPNGLSIRLAGENGLLDRAEAGQGITLAETAGTLRFNMVKGGAGDVTLRAVESIVGHTGDNLVSGRAITLQASGGSIGAGADDRVNVDTANDATGVFNAFAENGSIYLEEVSGDLRIERIRADAQDGMVDLVVDRHVLDANTLLEGSGLTEEERVRFWAEAGLIGEAAEKSLETTIEAMKERSRREFDEYWAVRGLDADEKVHNAYDPQYGFSFSPEDRARMLDDGVGEARIAEMEEARTAAYHRTHAFIVDNGGDAAAYDETFFEKNYKLSDAVLADLKEGYLWTEDELKGSINQALFSDRTDTNPFVEDPNIVAGALRIAAGGDIGELNGVDVFDLDPQGGINPDDLQRWFDALVQAERDDIIYVYERDGVRIESVGDQMAGGKLVSIRVERKEDLDVEIKGAVDIVAEGNIFLGSEEGDINVHLAQSNAKDGVVRLKSAQGLTNARLDEAAAVVGSNVVLESANASVGSAEKRLTLDADILTARAHNSIFVEQVGSAGDLRLDFVRAGNTADILVRNGALLDRRGDLMTNVRARTINLDALSIGTAGAGGGIGIGQLDGANARLNAVAREGSIYLEGTEEDIVLGQVSAEGEGDDLVVSIDVLAGSLLKGEGTGLNIVAEGQGVTTRLKATSGIGVLNAPIDVSLNRLDAENTGSGDIRIAERDDLVLLNAVNRAQGGQIAIAANDDLTIAPDGVVETADGAISLFAAAAADGSGGDVTQLAGKGHIDAGKGSLHVRGENIRLENPARAYSMRFETLRNGGAMAFSDLSIGAYGDFTGGRIDIGKITHTGIGGLLRLGFDDHTRPTETLAIGKVTSEHGILFDAFRVQEAVIGADTSRVVFPDAYVGRRMSLKTRETTIEVDQRSPAIKKAGVQIHQRPNVPFFFDIEGHEFRTDAQLIRFDRTNLTAVLLGRQSDKQYTQTVFDITELVARNGLYGAFQMFDFADLDLLGSDYLRNPVQDRSGEDEEPAVEDGEGQGLAQGEGEGPEQRAALACSSNPAARMVELGVACDG